MIGIFRDKWFHIHLLDQVNAHQCAWSTPNEEWWGFAREVATWLYCCIATIQGFFYVLPIKQMKMEWCITHNYDWVYHWKAMTIFNHLLSCQNSIMIQKCVRIVTKIGSFILAEGTPAREVFTANLNPLQLLIYRRAGAIWSVVGRSAVTTPSVAGQAVTAAANLFGYYLCLSMPFKNTTTEAKGSPTLLKFWTE